MNNSARQARTRRATFKLSPQTEEVLRNVVLNHAGIVLQDHQLNKLRATVNKACSHFGHKSAEDFLGTLNQGSITNVEMEYLIAGVTVGESYFFRDEDQVRLLREVCLPEIISRRRQGGEKNIRIWSAGCADGQEVYTLAMLLDGLLPDIDDWHVHLLGTDINKESLAAAIRGRYSKWSFRATPALIKKRYFTHRGNEYILKPHLRKLVHFSYLNLTEDSYPSFLTDTFAIDLILCRNVFIYFDSAHSNTVMHKFARCLADGGYLLLGASDHVDCPAGLERHYIDLVHYYTRNGHSVTEVKPGVSTPATPAPEPLPLEPAPVPEMPAKDNTEASKPLLIKPWSVTETKQVGRRQQALAQMIEDLGAARWDKVIAETEAWNQAEGEDALMHQYRAKALANIGKLEQAARFCERSLALDAVDKHSYLLLGMIWQEQEQYDQAETALRRAIYLDHEFVEAYYHLGMLLLQLGQQKSGIKQLSNALQLAERGDPDRPVHNAGDMTYGRLAEILQGEMEMYQ